jgi:hypothetical protein
MGVMAAEEISMAPNDGKPDQANTPNDVGEPVKSPKNESLGGRRNSGGS